MRWQWQWKLGNLRFDVIHQLGCLKAFNIPVGLRSRFFWFPEKWLKWFDCALRNRQSMCLCDTDWWFQIYRPAPSAVGWLAGNFDAALFNSKNDSLSPPLRSNNNCRRSVNSGRGQGAGGREVRWCLWLVQFTKLCLLEAMLGTMTETCFERKNVTGTNRNDYTNKSLKGEAKCRWLSFLNVASRSPD